MRKLIIDCDPGHDDAIAILIAYAHPEEFEILGLTTVCGNQTIDKVGNNALKIVELLDCDIPVIQGEAKPLKRDPEPQPMAHGESGMDGPVMANPTSTYASLSAVNWMRETILKEDKVTLVCLAPLTNIARLLTEYPEVKDRIEEIVLMGGSVYGGNILPKAEFNIYHDPEAAKIVFNSGVPITTTPLEVCKAGAFPLKEIDDFEGKGKISQFVYELLKFYSGYALRHNMDRTPIFDMTTIIYLLHPEYFKGRKMDVDIELDGQYTRGMTVCEEIGEYSSIDNPVNVLLDVDNEFHNRVFKEAIVALDKKGNKK